MTDGTGAANGNYDLRFYLRDALTAGNPVGATNTLAPVPVSNGLFTVTLDFGTGIFTGPACWLEIGVRTNGSVGAYAPLAPRQPLAATPYAITASNLTGTLAAGQLSGALPSAALAGTYSGAVTLNNPANSFSGNGTGLTNMNAAALGGLTAASFWKTGGNAGTTAGVNFLGTTDNQALELKVNSRRALRLEPNTNGAPNVIGGSSVNFVAPGVNGAVVAGGGAASYFGFPHTNSVAADFCAIGGGMDNAIVANADSSTIGGGGGNTIIADYSIIGGGAGNTIQIGASDSTIAGGFLNRIQDSAVDSVIGGGSANTIQTNSYESTIAGGNANTIGMSSSDSCIGGGVSNSVAGPFASVAGGALNHAGNLNAPYATVSGGSLNYAGTQGATVGGGYQNIASGFGPYETVGGGSGNVASGTGATVGGGLGNYAYGGTNSTVAGGYKNTASGPSATISGGNGNSSSGESSTVAGGAGNTSSYSYATVAGGKGNTSSEFAATVGGGYSNLAGTYGSVGGGIVNIASGNSATVGGGDNNAASGGAGTVAGGYDNTANGDTATVGGGHDNTASGYCSFAVGRYARAAHDLTFLWSSYANPAPTFIQESFGVSARNGFSINSGAQRPDGGGTTWMAIGQTDSNPAGDFIIASSGAKLTGAGVWQNSSDRDKKEHFAPVDAQAVLAKVAALPVTTWNYKTEPSGIRHLGPMAQEFKAAFGLGNDAKSIGTLDADGVALAAIQGLNQKVEEKEARIKELEARLGRLEQLMNQKSGGVK